MVWGGGGSGFSDTPTQHQEALFSSSKDGLNKQNTIRAYV